MTVTLDTSGLIALADAADVSHRSARAAFEAERGPFIVPVSILSEVGHVMPQRADDRVFARFLADIESGALVPDCGERDIGRIRELMERYADLPLGFADAAVVACAERNGGRVLAFDRDFAVVAREGTITVLPEPEG